MKNIHTNFLAEYILKLTGEYASANRIHDVLNLSLSYTYTLANNNKVRNRVKNGRTEYNMEDFIKNLELSYNNNVIDNPLTKEDSIIEKYELSPDELKEYENIKMTTSTLMFNGRPASKNDKIELERILKEFFVKALLKKRADEKNDEQKKKRNSKID